MKEREKLDLKDRINMTNINHLNNNGIEQMVFKSNSTPVTSSRIIAKYFEKRHDNVLRDIAELGALKIEETSEKDISKIGSISERTLYRGDETTEVEFFNKNFKLMSYKDSQNKEQKEYWLNESAFMLLVMGFTGEKALRMKIKFIEAFDKMKKHIENPHLNLSRMDILKMAIESEQKALELSEKIEADKPKVEFMDQVMTSKETELLGHYAKTIGLGPKQIFKILRDIGVLIQNERLPYQKHVDAGRFEVIPTLYKDRFGEPHVSYVARITQKGQIWLFNLLKQYGYNVKGINEKSAN